MPRDDSPVAIMPLRARDEVTCMYIARQNMGSKGRIAQRGIHTRNAHDTSTVTDRQGQKPKKQKKRGGRNMMIVNLIPFSFAFISLIHIHASPSHHYIPFHPMEHFTGVQYIASGRRLPITHLVPKPRTSKGRSPELKTPSGNRRGKRGAESVGVVGRRLPKPWTISTGSHTVPNIKVCRRSRWCVCMCRRKRAFPYSANRWRERSVELVDFRYPRTWVVAGSSLVFGIPRPYRS